MLSLLLLHRKYGSPPSWHSGSPLHSRPVIRTTPHPTQTATSPALPKASLTNHHSERHCTLNLNANEPQPRPSRRNCSRLPNKRCQQAQFPTQYPRLAFKSQGQHQDGPSNDSANPKKSTFVSFQPTKRHSDKASTIAPPALPKHRYPWSMENNATAAGIAITTATNDNHNHNHSHSHNLVRCVSQFICGQCRVTPVEQGRDAGKRRRTPPPAVSRSSKSWWVVVKFRKRKS